MQENAQSFYNSFHRSIDFHFNLYLKFTWKVRVITRELFLLRTRHGPSSVACNNYLNGSRIPFHLRAINDPLDSRNYLLVNFQPMSCNFSSPLTSAYLSTKGRRKNFDSFRKSLPIFIESLSTN